MQRPWKWQCQQKTGQQGMQAERKFEAERMTTDTARNAKNVVEFKGESKKRRQQQA